jgi:hypothetical protein
VIRHRNAPRTRLDIHLERHAAMPRRTTPLLALALLLAVTGTPERALAQDLDRGVVRVGLSFGGTGFVGLTTEYRRGDWAGELTLGTVTFREVAVAVSGKRYATRGVFQPVAGLGLWSLTAWTADGSGSILILRAPLAVEWNVTGGHATGIEVALNRALAVNRLDPEDDTPPSRNIVPIPGVYYRYGWTP